MLRIGVCWISFSNGRAMGIFDKKARIAEYVRKYAAAVRRGAAYVRVYKNIAAKLEGFEAATGRPYRNDNFGYAEFTSFVAYLEGQGLRRNSVRNVCDKVKFILSLMAKDAYKVNLSAFQVQVKAEYVTTVYLTVEEITRLYHYTGFDKAARLAVDLFVVGCFTGMRFSDYSTLTAENLDGDFIAKKTRKTGVTVKIPTHPTVREILANYGGFPPYRGSKQNFNKVIKNAVRKVGIRQAVLCEYTKGGEIVREVREKWQMVASHTARRSFATNAYLAGIPIARIMMLTGHQSETSFFNYIKIRSDENADELSRHPFFS